MPASRGPGPRTAFRRILAVGPDEAAVQAATAMAHLTGARLIERRADERRAGRSIARLARREAADLVVVGTGLASATDLEWLGRPAIEAGVAVLAIPPNVPAGLRFERIGVGYDGEAAARRALASAIELVGLAGAAVGCLDLAYVDDGDGPADEPDARGLRSGRDAMIEWWLDSLRDQVPAPVRTHCLEGSPARALADLSHDLDLLVIGARGRGWLRRFVDASVSAELLAQTRCPLLIVPERSKNRSR